MKVLTFVMAIAACSISAFAQQTNGNNRTPEGKWVLESVAATEENVQVPFSMNGIGFNIPDEMDIRQEEMTIVNKERTETGKYVIDEDIFRFYLSTFPLIVQWKMVEGKLLLQWEQDTKDGKRLAIVLTYSQK